jgi:hypothetical protein
MNITLNISQIVQQILRYYVILHYKIPQAGVWKKDRERELKICVRDTGRVRSKWS